MPFYPATCGQYRSFSNTSHIVRRHAPKFLAGSSSPARFLFLPCAAALAHCRCDFCGLWRTPHRNAVDLSSLPRSHRTRICLPLQLHGNGRSTGFACLLLRTLCSSTAFCIHRQPYVFATSPYGIAYSSPLNKKAARLIQIVRCIACSSS